MYSLMKIIEVMTWNGGWIDRKNQEIYKDLFVSRKDGSFSYVTMNSNMEQVNVLQNDERFLRIPSLNPDYFAQHTLKISSIGVDILEKYGIDEYMDADFNVFLKDCEIKPHGVNDVWPCDQANRIIEDLNLYEPSYREYGIEEIIRWCNENNVKFIDDYVD